MTFCCKGCRALLFTDSDIHAVQNHLDMTRVACVRDFQTPITTVAFGGIDLLRCGGCAMDIGAVRAWLMIISIRKHSNINIRAG